MHALAKVGWPLSPRAPELKSRPAWRQAATLLLATGLLLPFQSMAAGQCQRAKLTADDAAVEDLFGCSVAVSSGVIVVGARFHGATGCAYVYRRLGGRWSQVAALVNDGAGGGSNVGRSVAVDGDFAVIGATGTWPGAFERSGEDWTQVDQLIAADYTSGSLFGAAVAANGDCAVVGAPHDDDMGYRSGSAYVFERDPTGAWPLAFKLLAADGEPYDKFGSALAIDGDTVVVGAPYDQDLGNYAGSAYIFERDPNGVWSQTSKLLPDDGGGFWDFGGSVAVNDGVVLIGADQAISGPTRCGAAYAFERDLHDIWRQTAKLSADDGQVSDAFGRSVALDGNIAVIGAPWDHQEPPGSVYVFVREADATWSQIAKLVPDDGEYDDEFGTALAVDGNTAVIGAWQDDDLGDESGSAYVFAVGPDDDGDGIMDVCLCHGDLDGDLDIDLADLAQLLANYDTPSGADPDDGDIDADGDVDLADLAALLAVYGTICP